MGGEAAYWRRRRLVGEQGGAPTRQGFAACQGGGPRARMQALHYARWPLARPTPPAWPDLLEGARAQHVM